jgi:hypothetical protein
MAAVVVVRLILPEGSGDRHKSGVACGCLGGQLSTVHWERSYGMFGAVGDAADGPVANHTAVDSISRLGHRGRRPVAGFRVGPPPMSAVSYRLALSSRTLPDHGGTPKARATSRSPSAATPSPPMVTLARHDRIRHSAHRTRENSLVASAHSPVPRLLVSTIFWNSARISALF